jgi:diguanylate cyclase (GGDEF)-like protein
LRELAGTGLPVATPIERLSDRSIPADAGGIAVIVTALPGALALLAHQAPALRGRIGNDCFLLCLGDDAPRRRIPPGVIHATPGTVVPELLGLFSRRVAHERRETFLARWASSLFSIPDYPLLVPAILEGLTREFALPWAAFLGAEGDELPGFVSHGLSPREETRCRRTLRETAASLEGDHPLLFRGKDGSIRTDGRPSPGGWWVVVASRPAGIPSLVAFPAARGLSGDGCRRIADTIRQASGLFSRVRTLRDLTFQDDLTCLYNYRFLRETLLREIERCRRLREVFSVLFIDLDNFKDVNDSNGHLVGSELLRQVAEIMACHVREYDTVARYGGDEFLVIMPEAGTREAYRVAERLRKTIEDTGFLVKEGLRISLTASIGLATYPVHATDRESMLEMADKAMYRAKQGKKNLVYIAE